MMDEFFREVEEDIRRDRLERLARRHGTKLIAAAVLVVAVVAGATLWTRWQDWRRQDDTLRLALALGGTDGAGKDAALALAAYKPAQTSGASALAQLYQAVALSRSGDNAGALAVYEALASGGGADGKALGAVDPVLRDLAVLALAYRQLDSHDPAALTTRLAPLTVDGNPWRFQARELTALIALRAGQGKEAAEQYRTLAEDAGAPPELRARARDLASHLGDIR